MSNQTITTQFAVVKIDNLTIGERDYSVMDIYCYCDSKEEALDELKAMYQPYEHGRWAISSQEFIIEEIHTLNWNND